MQKIYFAVMFAVILICVVPMSWNPNWSGENFRHHNQYQFLADALLKGQLHLDTPVDSRLAAMENPYDPQERERLNLKPGVDFEWDTAYYDGRYYVYFGVVPALLTFAPYKIIFGEPLAAYRATQIFVAIFIVGFFVLLKFFAQKFFPRLPPKIYLSLAIALSLVSISYCTEAPALYCTAIASGLALEVWSVYFFVRAAFTDRRNFLAEIFFGAMLGALAFGCKPTVALANILILPLLPKLLRGRKSFLALSVPFIVVAACLMTYNCLRFDNVFEFGQSYQLTIADHHAFGNFSERFSLSAQIAGIVQNFFGFGDLPTDEKKSFVLRYVIFWTPIILLGKNFRAALKVRGLQGFVVALIVAPLLITAVQVQWAVFLIERYRLEIYWLLALLSFIALGLLCERREKNFCAGIFILCAVTIFQCVVLFLTPNDLNFTATGF